MAFDDIPEAQYLQPALTTMHLDFMEVDSEDELPHQARQDAAGGGLGSQVSRGT